MTKEKEAFDILLQHIETEADWSDYEKVKNAHKTVEDALKRLEALDNAEPSEALKCLEYIKSQSPICYDNDGKFYEFEKEFDTIKQALMERIVWKHIHNTKVKIPLCDVFNNPVPLSKEERHKYIEHIYYHWEEMKESLEDKIASLQEELKQALIKAEKEHKVLEIIKNKPQAELSCIQLGKIKTYEEYLEYTSVWELDLYGDMVYEEEEFDLLKEVLECAD